MGYPLPPGPPPPQWLPPALPPKTPANIGDVVASVLLLVFTVLVAGAGSVMGLFSLAFLDHCPPDSCSVDGAVTAVMGTVGVVAVVGLTGLVLTVIRLSARKPAWPFALGTLALCIAAFVIGGFAYTLAVS